MRKHLGMLLCLILGFGSPLNAEVLTPPLPGEDSNATIGCLIECEFISLFSQLDEILGRYRFCESAAPKACTSAAWAYSNDLISCKVIEEFRYTPDGLYGYQNCLKKNPPAGK